MLCLKFWCIPLKDPLNSYVFIHPHPYFVFIRMNENNVENKCPAKVNINHFFLPK